MSLIINTDALNERIGRERTRRVEEFRRLVDERMYKEAFKYFNEQGAEGQGDIRNYGGLHLRQLAFSGL